METPMTPRRGWRVGGIDWGALTWGVLAMTAATAQGSTSGGEWPASGPNGGGVPLRGPHVHSAAQLLGLSPSELDWLYQHAAAGAIPEGKARGQAILAPGTRWARPISKAARVLWQGKVFHGAEATAVNRFFGLPVIRGNVSYGESWRDGRPAIILDYQDTSRLYANYRDELREVAPGLFLGLMYARTAPRPTLRMYFALETRPRGD
jgi:hypothetical protein